MPGALSPPAAPLRVPPAAGPGVFRSSSKSIFLIKPEVPERPEESQERAEQYGYYWMIFGKKSANGQSGVYFETANNDFSLVKRQCLGARLSGF